MPGLSRLYIYSILFMAFLLQACSESNDKDPATEVSTDANSAVITQAALDLVADEALLERGRKLFSSCSMCHAVDANMMSPAGPHLGKVFGRQLASMEGFPYTNALRSAGGTWTMENLDKFIENPMSTYPGTSMAFGGIKKADDRKAIIAFLASKSVD